MPFGALKTSEIKDAIPVHSPPYPSEENQFTDVTCLTIRYRTTAEAVKHLLPDELEFEDEPLATATVIRYGMSSIGPYTEFVHQVEVKYNGVAYNYGLNLILDNQAAIFSGRERFGIPKVFGNVVFSPNEPAYGTGGFISARVERPFGTTIAHFGFKPRGFSPFGALPIDENAKKSLYLRVIPSPISGAPPSLREFIPLQFALVEGEVWTGIGSLGFSDFSGFDTCLPVVRYEGATFVRNGRAEMQAVTEVFKV